MTHKLKEEDMLGRQNLYFFLIVIATIILDRITKYFAFNKLTEPIEFSSFFSLYFTTNTGAAFGILKGKTFVLTIISIIFIILIIYKIKEIVNENYFWAAALILGGAVSNLFDRVFYGFVIDFISVMSFPIFNFADSAITIGATGLFVYLLLDYKNNKKE